MVALQNIGCFLRPVICHKKMTQREKVFIFLRKSPYSAITKDIKAFTLDYSHKICIRVISNISNMRCSVSSPDETPKRELKIRRAAEYF